MKPEKPRVRFALSPTGLLHVGNARTALCNWLFARRTGGTFLLRIEDTGMERERYENQLLEDLHWLGLDWDEGPCRAGDSASGEVGTYGPYRQSERLPIYAEHTERLLAEGKAYRCFCTPKELEEERAAAEHGPQIYSRRCLALKPAEIEKNLAAGMPFAVRLKIPGHPLRFHDMIRGAVEFPPETVSDPILVRSATGGAAGLSGGVPVYNYVVAIDDALMHITHVIRGDDPISDTPKQVAIYEAFGWPVPEFAHLPTIPEANHERLSKRHEATSIASFREMGYLPEALDNYLALPGWGAEDGKTETFTLDELIHAFSLERVTPSPAVFDFGKLNWLNRRCLKLASFERILALSLPYFKAELPMLSIAADRTFAGLVEGPAAEHHWFEMFLQIFLPYVDHLSQLHEKAAFVFGFDPDAARMQEKNAAVLAVDSARTVIGEFAARVRAHSGRITADTFQCWVKEIKAATGIKGAELSQPIRIALTGARSGPDFDKLVPLLQDGASLCLCPGVPERIEQFAGV